MKSTIHNPVIAILLFLLIASFSLVFGQNKKQVSDDNQSIDQAQEIIKLSLGALNKNAEIKKINSISVELKGTRVVAPGQQHEYRTNRQISVSINFPSQIKFEEYIDFSVNQQLLTEIWNSPLYAQTSNIFVDGKPFNFGNNLGSVAPKATKEQRIKGLHEKIFNKIFPLLLSSYWTRDFQLKYVGEAESKDFKADVIEAFDKNKNRFRFFFDKQTHLPILMSEYLYDTSSKTEIEQKTFYSDFREISGLLVAHKVMIQTGQMMSEEFNIEKIQINPIFKSNLFYLKEDKVNPYDK